MISNRLLFKETLKRNIWTIVLWGIIFLLSILLPPILDISSYDGGLKELLTYSPNLENIRYYFEASGLNVLIPLVGMACIMGIKNFSYLHNRKQVDFYHSLPIKRGKLFLLNYVMGIIAVIPIYIIVTIITTIIVSLLGASSCISYMEVFKAIIWCTTFYIVIYSIFVLATILTGNIVISLLLGVFFLVIQPLWLFLREILISSFSGVNQVLFYVNEFTMPILEMFKRERFYPNYYNYVSTTLHQTKFNFWFTILFYIIFSVAIILISYLVFLKRKSEKSGVSIAFDILKGPLKYIVIVTSSIYIGFLFNFITISEWFWFIFGIILACILLHFVAEIIYEFDFKAIFKNWYSIFGCIIIAIIIVFGFKAYLNKAINYIPNIDKIKQVDIMLDTINSGLPLEDRELIENIVKLHQEALNYDEYFEDYDGVPEYPTEKLLVNGKYENYGKMKINFKVGYKMKNGKVLYRRLSAVATDEVIKLVNDITSNKEVLLKRNELFKINVENIKNSIERENSIQIVNNEERSFDIIKEDSIKQLITILQKEVLEKSDEEKGKLSYGLYLELQSEGIYEEFDIYSNYTETIKFIEEKTTMTQEMPKLENIKEIYFYYNGKYVKKKEGIEYILKNIEKLPLNNQNIANDLRGYIKYEDDRIINYFVIPEKFPEVIKYLEDNNFF